MPFRYFCGSDSLDDGVGFEFWEAACGADFFGGPCCRYLEEEFASEVVGIVLDDGFVVDVLWERGGGVGKSWDDASLRGEGSRQRSFGCRERLVSDWG